MVTLGQKLGLPPWSSNLMKKAKRAGLDSVEALENLAVARGCWHYRSGVSLPSPGVTETAFSNVDLAIALLSPLLPYSPHTIRIGAAMVGAPGNDVESLARLAIAERVIATLRYICSAAIHFEPDNPFWKSLLERLPDTPPVPEGILPHPTRFVSMTGFTRQGPGRFAVWIRPRADLAAAHG